MNRFGGSVVFCLVGCSGGGVGVGTVNPVDGGVVTPDSGNAASGGGNVAMDGSPKQDDGGIVGGNDASSGACSVCPKGCFDLQNDVNNCGSCGSVCGKGPSWSCVAGACQEACTSHGQPGRVCPDLGGSSCTILANDAANCGACGNVCSSSMPNKAYATAGCLNGVCVDANTESLDCTTANCATTCTALCSSWGKTCLDIGGAGGDVHFYAYATGSCYAPYTCAATPPATSTCGGQYPVGLPISSIDCTCSP